MGLGRYEAAFRENEIDERVLPNLTQEDLKEIGVGPVGHRRMLLEAIAALRTDASGQTPSPNAAAAPIAPSVQSEDRAERRQVTVMFSDLVGSTALSARMDPEDLREVISAYQKCVADTVCRFSGFVAKYMGDGVLVYFGYPQAHEDDAEGAVRAGLELISAVGGLKTQVPLQTRVGIATGLVVIGDLIGSGSSQEHAIVGETPNLAARLQSIAEPNSVVIAASTRKLVGNLFELGDLGSKNLKGIAEPVRIWAVLRPSTVESRFEALHATGLTPLVGREEELELLLRRWSRSKTGEGQVVLLSGEAGIGKSRLTAALLERIADEPHTCLRYFCSPQHTDSAFYPIIGQMQRAARLAPDDTLDAKLDKFDAALAPISTSKQDSALFAEMLSLPTNGRYPKLQLSPEQRRQKTVEALVSRMEALTRYDPVLTIIEDVHWIDPTSLEVFDRIVDRIAALRVLLLATFRPEFEPPWIGRFYVTALTVNRLTPREMGAMIDSVVGNRQLPARVRHDIIERTDGIPLFVEEMTKAVLEAENVSAAQHMTVAIPFPAPAVPASLYASLMARLDKLGPAKEVAQTGAAIGREFSHDLLTAVVRKPEAELGSALNRLIQAGLLLRQGQPPHAIYLFKHALVQDTAYATLLREPRRALNARIVETIEKHFPQIAESHPQLLARYCTEAGLIEKAAHLWGKAGQRSVERSALIEAIDQFTRALAHIVALPATRELRRAEIMFQVALITPLLNVKGFAARETTAATERARLLIEQAEALGDPVEDPLLLFSVLFGSWIIHFVAFNGEALRGLAAQFLSLAEKQGTTAPLMMGHLIMGNSLAATGDPAEARAHYDQAIVLYEPSVHRALVTRFAAQDPRVAILSFRSWTLWMLGYPTAAVTDADRAVTDAREMGHAATLLLALLWSSLAKMFCGDYSAANALGEELFALADENGSLTWKMAGMHMQGCLSVLIGKATCAIQTITSGLAVNRSMGSTVLEPQLLSFLARAHAERSEFDRASRCIDEAMALMEKTDETWYKAETYRIAGEITLKSPEPDASKAQR